MEYKKEIESLLLRLKKHDKSRRTLESDLGYSANYIDQALARGGNEALFNALTSYLSKLDGKESKFSTNEEIIASQQATIKTLTKLLEKSQERVLILEAILDKGKAGGRRHSA